MSDLVPFRSCDAKPGDTLYFVEDTRREIPMRFKFMGFGGSVVVTFVNPESVGRHDAILKPRQIVREVA